MLHIKYRPKDFDDIVGHKEVVGSIKSLFKDTLPHVFLFTGPSGIGKTTLARIIASRLAHPDEIIELNMADTRGIDSIRELINTAYFVPMYGGNKVYILDEVHQISKDAANAILKVLEDTPEHTYFILCTTEPDKIIHTIRTRCHVYTLKKLRDKELVELINKICKLEHIDINEDIKDLIVYKADGSPRQALVYLNQVRDVKSIDEAVNVLSDEIEEERECIDLIKAILRKKSWHDLMKIYNSITIEPEKIRINICFYLSGCIRNSRNTKELAKFTKLLEIFINPLTYATAKPELLFLLSQAYFCSLEFQ